LRGRGKNKVPDETREGTSDQGDRAPREPLVEPSNRKNEQGKVVNRGRRSTSRSARSGARKKKTCCGIEKKKPNRKGKGAGEESLPLGLRKKGGYVFQKPPRKKGRAEQSPITRSF